jgi:hypothetical protein
MTDAELKTAANRYEELETKLVGTLPDDERKSLGEEWAVLGKQLKKFVRDTHGQDKTVCIVLDEPKQGRAVIVRFDSIGHGPAEGAGITVRAHLPPLPAAPKR